MWEVKGLMTASQFLNNHLAGGILSEVFELSCPKRQRPPRSTARSYYEVNQFLLVDLF